MHSDEYVLMNRISEEELCKEIHRKAFETTLLTLAKSTRPKHWAWDNRPVMPTFYPSPPLVVNGKSTFFDFSEKVDEESYPSIRSTRSATQSGDEKVSYIIFRVGEPIYVTDNHDDAVERVTDMADAMKSSLSRNYINLHIYCDPDRKRVSVRGYEHGFFTFFDKTLVSYEIKSVERV